MIISLAIATDKQFPAYFTRQSLEEVGAAEENILHLEILKD